MFVYQATSQDFILMIFCIACLVGFSCKTMLLIRLACSTKLIVGYVRFKLNPKEFL